MAQRLNEGHGLIVGFGFHLLQARAPDGHLIQQPLTGGRITALTADDHLLGEARHIRSKHGVQPQNRTFVHRQHMGKRLALDAGDIHQQTIGGQVAEPVDDLTGDVDGHGHHDQTRVGQDLVSPWPVCLFEGLDPVAGEAEHMAEQAAKLALSAYDDHFAKIRLHALEAGVFFAGIRFTHDPAQHILDEVPRHPQQFGLGATAGQHARLPVRCIDGQAVAALHLTHFPHQSQSCGQQIDQLSVHRINLVPEGIQLFSHIQSLLAPLAAAPCDSRGNKVSLRGQ